MQSALPRTMIFSESVRVVQLPHGYPVRAGRDSVAPGVAAAAVPAVLGLDGSVGRRPRDGRRDAETVIIKLHLLLLEENKPGKPLRIVEIVEHEKGD